MQAHTYAIKTIEAFLPQTPRRALSDRIISRRPNRSRSSRICTAPASSRGNPSSPSMRGPHPASRSAVSSVLWEQGQMEKNENDALVVAQTQISTRFKPTKLKFDVNFQIIH
jgi:hypothetical protein